MHTSVIRSPQAMSNDQSYRPRSPKLPGFNESQQQIPRLTRLPSYQIEEPNLPRGYSFSPRGSYDASPFFSQPLQQVSNPQSGAQQANIFPPQSPPRLNSASLPDQLHTFSPVSYVESPRQQQISSPFQQSPQQITQHNHSQPHPYLSQFDDMARLRSRKPVNYNEDHNGAQYDEPVTTYPPTQPTHHMPQMQQMQQMPQMPPMPQQPQQFTQHQMPSHQFMQQPIPFNQPFQTPAQVPTAPPAPTLPQIDVKTKFPVARIKRIMQADEDVGKVAQATPTAVSKALEMFMIALVTKGAAEANKNNSKRVTATHLKHALLTDPQFDFLNEICEAVPDEGGKGSKGRAKSEAKSEDSDEEMGAAPKKRARAGKKKKGGDDEGSD